MRLSGEIGPRDHVRGSAKASVTLVEYGDYESPACIEAHYMIRALQVEMGDRLQFVFRCFPLPSIHRFAEYAAHAAKAAARQGRFWQIHDFLYENPGAIQDGRLLTFAKTVLMDSSRFEREIAERTFADRVDTDIQSGIQSGVNGTPTFFINGLRFEGMWNFENLLVALTSAVAEPDSQSVDPVMQNRRVCGGYGE